MAGCQVDLKEERPGLGKEADSAEGLQPGETRGRFVGAEGSGRGPDVRLLLVFVVNSDRID